MFRWLSFRRRHRKISYFQRVVLFLFIMMFLITLLFEKSIQNIQKNLIQNQATIMSQRAVDSAVEAYISDNDVSYDVFAKLNYGEDGSLQAITTNSLKINHFKSAVNISIEEQLSKLYRSSTKVPIGAFLGITMLNSFGPKINLTYFLIGSVNSELKSYVVSSGINQTVHHIELVVNVSAVLTCLGHDEPINFSSNYEIAQTVIAADVPSTYINGTGEIDCS